MNGWSLYQRMQYLKSHPKTNCRLINQYLKKWNRIGTEVILRKTLIEAARKDLDILYPTEIVIEKKRHFAIAATDVFVEKAQAILTERGRSLFIWGAYAQHLQFSH
jgi:hypothetical protein